VQSVFLNPLRAAAVVLLLGIAARPAHAENQPCAARTFEDQSFTVCLADPASMDFKLYLKRGDETLYGSLEAIPDDGLLFATNAGMYTPEYAAAGLYVENGIQRKALNTRKSGYGNFHLQPNGVFWVQDGHAAVTTTEAYARLKPSADIATQSGPMLVIAGAINPKFDDNGPSRTIRNGVGVMNDGRVAIAISEGPVSFGAFARLFRDDLKCPNALYLDGSVSRLRIAGETRDSFGPPLGPILGIYKKSAERAP
jgi:uncharacterized protein YigE (DUF2233 family)